MSQIKLNWQQLKGKKAFINEKHIFLNYLFVLLLISLFKALLYQCVGEERNKMPGDKLRFLPCSFSSL